MPSAPKFCDCPKCPCNVPLQGARYGKKDCAECLAGNHLTWAGERAAPATTTEEATGGL